MRGAAKNELTRPFVARTFRRQLGIAAMRSLDVARNGVLPVSQAPLAARGPRPGAAELGVPESRRLTLTARALTDAYRSGRATPSAVLDAVLREARAFSEQRLGAFCAFSEEAARRAAAESDERYRSGAALGPLDGVIVPVKEEMAVAGLPTRLGTNVESSLPAAKDSVVVERLRRAGAVIPGHTAMTEYGMSPLGGNTSRAMPRNPHNAAHLAGGSSTGSAVAVALGLAPVAVGLDGGGSIRTPAAFTGIFGIKPTFGRVPLTGHGLGRGTSMVHLGPLGASTHDLAIFLDAVADANPALATGNAAPPEGGFVRALGRSVRDLRIGFDAALWEQAQSSVTLPGREAVDALVRQGANLVRIELPLARHAAAVGYVTIGLEVLSALGHVWPEHWREIGPDLALTLSVLESFPADDYLLAQRVRNALRHEARAALADLDALVLPSTACTAPRVSDAEARGGFVDPVALDAVSRYAFLANVTGLPAASAPVGVDADGLPIGLQIIGDAWDEATVLAIVAELERAAIARPPRPQHYAEILEI